MTELSFRDDVLFKLLDRL